MDPGYPKTNKTKVGIPSDGCLHPKDPNDREAFDAHMARVRASPDVTQRVVTRGGQLVGSMASFVVDGDTEISFAPARDT